MDVREFRRLGRGDKLIYEIGNPKAFNQVKLEVSATGSYHENTIPVEVIEVIDLGLFATHTSYKPRFIFRASAENLTRVEEHETQSTKSNRRN